MLLLLVRMATQLTGSLHSENRLSEIFAYLSYMLLLELRFLPADFFAAAFLRGADFLADFFVADFLLADFLVAAFFVAAFFVADFFVADFFVAAFFFGEGTFAPFSLASDNPMAIACLGLVTFPPLPPGPERSVPLFFLFMALSTDLEAPFEYLGILLKF